MKIQLFVEKYHDSISFWTPNAISIDGLFCDSVCQRLFVDFYFNDGHIFNYCGNRTRLKKIYPGVT